MTTTMQTSLDLSAATLREPLGPRAEGLSGAAFERVVLDGDTYVVKRLSYETDWVMRAVGDIGVPRVVRMFAAGLFDQLPDILDTTVTDVAYDPDTGLAELLMRDVSDAFLRDEAAISLDQQALFLDAMAQLHSATRDLVDDLGLTTPAQRWQMLSPAFAAAERRRGPVAGVPALLGPMWQRLGENAPRLHRTLVALTADPQPLVTALATTPRTLVHGDWKGGNLGVLPDGRVLLVDWAMPGEGAGCADLAWYLAVNCDRLPVSKEASIALYRDALERKGIDTAGWFERQLELALVGAFCQLGWSKTEGAAELSWWVDRVTPVAQALLA